MFEDSSLQIAELPTRLESQFFEHRCTRRCEELERVGLPFATVEREHELGDQALTQRVSDGQALQLGEELVVLAEGESRRDVCLGRGKPELFESFRFAARELVVGEPCQSASAR